jgi:hypothetical protein
MAMARSESVTQIRIGWNEVLGPDLHHAQTILQADRIWLNPQD